jgi:hypothetical protein
MDLCRLREYRRVIGTGRAAPFEGCDIWYRLYGKGLAAGVFFTAARRP